MQISSVPESDDAWFWRSAARDSTLSIRVNAIVYLYQHTRVEKSKAFMTYINDILDLSEHGSHRLTNDRDRVEQTSFADQDVQEDLVNANKLHSLANIQNLAEHTHLAECIEDSIALRSSWYRGHVIHLGNGSGSGGNDIRKTGNDLRERTLANYDQWTDDNSDA